MAGDSESGAMKLIVFLGVAVLVATLTLPLGAFGQQTANDFKRSGTAKAMKGDWDGAIADYTKAIELNPKDATVYCNRGMAKHNNKKSDEDGAIADLTKAIELNPTYATAFKVRAYAKKAKGDQVGAEADFAQFDNLIGHVPASTQQPPPSLTQPHD